MLTKSFSFYIAARIGEVVRRVEEDARLVAVDFHRAA